MVPTASFIQENPILILFLVYLWTIPWKGMALWKSARSGQIFWFLAFLFLNTLAILEIVYIFFVLKKNKLK
jgi:hypothetical protein